MDKFLSKMPPRHTVSGSGSISSVTAPTPFHPRQGIMNPLPAAVSASEQLYPPMKQVGDDNLIDDTSDNDTSDDDMSDDDTSDNDTSNGTSDDDTRDGTSN